MSDIHETSPDVERKYWVALNSVAGMDPVTLRRLVDCFGSAGAAWRASESDLRTCEPMRAARSRSELPLDSSTEDSSKKRLADSLLEARSRGDGSAELAKAESIGCRVYSMLDAGYPPQLRDIRVPPPVLFVQGGADLDAQRCVSLVGTRTCSGYGRRVAQQMASELAAEGYTVVSGFAHGIDAASHRGALEAGGVTLAVKAVGVDVEYPSDHTQLGREIIDSGGALVSEFSIGRRVMEKWQFDRRNRIISGLCRGVIVVQSRSHGGSLLTARHAMEQGREVFGVPGDIYSKLSEGCHALIKQGAHLAETARDVMDVLGDSPQPAQTELALASPANLEGLQKHVFEFLCDEPRHFDEICSHLKGNARDVSSSLMMLEMKGLIFQAPGKRYGVTRK